MVHCIMSRTWIDYSHIRHVFARQQLAVSCDVHLEAISDSAGNVEKAISSRDVVARSRREVSLISGCVVGSRPQRLA